MKVTFALVAALAAFVAAKPIKECAARPAKGTAVGSSDWAQNSGSTSAKPAEEKPANDKPANDKPSEDKPADDEPASTAATCPNDNGKVLAAGGSCQCEFQINCNVKATPGETSLFWQKDSGKLISTLAECNKICDDNDKCEATLWVDDATSSEYHLCWQTSNLGPTTGEGIARISYKESCKGSCSASYSKE